MAGKSTKGATWERKIARFITNWISGQDQELYCWRSPGSGSVATINLGNKAISGDLFPLKQEAAPFFDVFSVECKNGYPGTNPLLFFGNMKTNDLRDFWVQSCRDADKAGKLPFLIYNQAGKRPPLVGMCPIGLNRYFGNLVRFSGDYLSVAIHFPMNKELPDLFLYEMEDVFNSVSYEDFKKL